MSPYVCYCTNVVYMFCVYCIYYYVNKFEARSLFKTLIHKLEFGKSAGPDGICAEALKCAHDQLSVLLSLCFTLFLSHGYLPRPN